MHRARNNDSRLSSIRNSRSCHSSGEGDDNANNHNGCLRGATSSGLLRWPTPSPLLFFLLPTLCFAAWRFDETVHRANDEDKEASCQQNRFGIRGGDEAAVAAARGRGGEARVVQVEDSCSRERGSGSKQYTWLGQGRTGGRPAGRDRETTRGDTLRGASQNPNLNSKIPPRINRARLIHGNETQQSLNWLPLFFKRLLRV